MAVERLIDHCKLPTLVGCEGNKIGIDEYRCLQKISENRTGSIVLKACMNSKSRKSASRSKAQSHCCASGITYRSVQISIC